MLVPHLPAFQAFCCYVLMEQCVILLFLYKSSQDSIFPSESWVYALCGFSSVVIARELLTDTDPRVWLCPSGNEWESLLFTAEGSWATLASVNAPRIMQVRTGERRKRDTDLQISHSSFEIIFFFIRVQTSSLPSTSVSEKIILKSKHLFGLAILVQLYKWSKKGLQG